MKVIVKGTMNVEQLAKKLIEVAEHTASKLEADHEDVKINGFNVHEAEVTFKFDVEGAEEAQVLTVEHHEDMTELFTWVVDTEKDSMVSNEHDSLFDVWTVAQVKGDDFQFEEVESVYNVADLANIPELDEKYSDMAKKVFEHKDGFKVVQVTQNGKLVQEYKLIPKE